MFDGDPKGPAETLETASDAILETTAPADDLEAPADDSPAPASVSTPEAASASPEAPAEPSGAPPAFTPPSGEPFTFKVDGREIAPNGATVAGDYIVIPKAVWDRELRPNYLGDRGTWRQRELGYQRELQQARQTQTEDGQRAKALIGVVDQLFADPQKLLAAAENWQVEGPKLRAEAEAKLYQTRLQEFEQRDAQQRAEQEQQALLPVLDNHLATTVEDLLAEAGVTWQGNATEEARWKDFVKALEEDVGLPALFLRDHQGRLSLDEDRVRRAFQRELARSRVQQQVAKVVEKKVAANTAVVTKPAAKPAPKVATARDKDTGKFVAEEPFDPQAYLRGVKFIES